MTETKVRDVMKSIDAKFDRFMEVLNSFVKKVIKEVNNFKALTRSNENTSRREHSSKKVEEWKERKANKKMCLTEENEEIFSLEQILLEVADFPD